MEEYGSAVQELTSVIWVQKTLPPCCTEETNNAHSHCVALVISRSSSPAVLLNFHTFHPPPTYSKRLGLIHCVLKVEALFDIRASLHGTGNCQLFSGN